MSTRPRPVVVSVDGTPGGQRAVQYAALEANRLGAPLSIILVNPGVLTGRPLPTVQGSTGPRSGFDVLEDARCAAHGLVPDLDVDTRLLSGTTVATLATCSGHGSLLVLGGERHSFVGQVCTGDVVAGVAAQSQSPVVIVPPEWEPAPGHGRIVVGVKDVERSAGLVATGLELAHHGNGELVVLHAWKAPSGYDGILTHRDFIHEFGRRQTALLETLVDVRRPEHPHVPMRIEVLHEEPRSALVHAAAEADRLLIGRPRHGGLFHHLGHVGRAVLHEAQCPVEVHALDQATASLGPFVPPMPDFAP